MTQSAPRHAVPAVSGFADGVWLVRGRAEARQVIEDSARFRAAAPPEFVPGRSKSFFLATDAAGPDGRSRFRTALAAALSPVRLRTLDELLLVPLAARLAGRLPTDGTSFDPLDDYIRPYTRQISHALAGLPGDVAVHLGARIKVAAELVVDDPADAAASALLAEVWSSIEQVTRSGQLDPEGLAGFALGRGLISADEVPLLVVPLLEMAVLDLSGALTAAVVGAVSGVPAHVQPAPSDRRATRAAVWEAARRLDDIVITRVAVEPQLIGGRQIRAGDRVLVDVPAANADVPALPDPHSVLPDPRVDHLSFGAGEHACMGRELALAVATAGLSGLLGRGVPQPADGVGGLRLLPRSGSTT